jgi:hypothetical protein
LNCSALSPGVCARSMQDGPHSMTISTSGTGRGRQNVADITAVFPNTFIPLAKESKLIHA